MIIGFCLSLLIATISVTSDYEPSIGYDIGLNVEFPPSNITVSSPFNITLWINSTSTFDSFILYNLTWLAGSVNVTNVWLPTGYWDFSAKGTINNDSGYLNNPQGFNYTGYNNTNMTILSFYFSTLLPCRCRVNISSFKTEYEGTPIAQTNCYNKTLIIHPEPTYDFNATQGDSNVTLTWTRPSHTDEVYIYCNTSGYPTNHNRTDTPIYNGSASEYVHSGLSPIKHYYSIWTYNTTYNIWSYMYQHANATPYGPLDILNPYPANHSTEITRPPVNLSAYISGTNIEVEIYFWNMTPIVEGWTLVANFTATNEWISQTTLSAWGTDFIWGNTTYTWAIRARDGNEYMNRSFVYTTTELADGGNARYDVNNDDTISVFDVSGDWAHRTMGGFSPYEGIYDVNHDDAVNTFDVSLIWANRTT